MAGKSSNSGSAGGPCLGQFLPYELPVIGARPRDADANQDPSAGHHRRTAYKHSDTIHTSDRYTRANGTCRNRHANLNP
jgi:hypothetical protein